MARRERRCGIRSGPNERGQYGSSLVEVVVATSLLSLVMFTVFQGVTSTPSALENTSSRLRNLDEARVLMAATSKDLRTAVRLQSGTSPFAVANALTMPPSNSALKAEVAVGKGGCLYTGPTRIRLNTAGTMTVNSPFAQGPAHGLGREQCG